MKLSKMKKDELIDTAINYGIKVDDDATKKDLIAALANVDFSDDETETEENEEHSEYTLDAEFREWWSGASKADRNAFNAARNPDSIKAPHSSIEEKPRTKIKRT